MRQDKFACTFPVSVTLIYEEEFAKEREEIDLLHVVLWSFLFHYLPGLWPLTKKNIMFTELELGGLLLFKLKKLIRNCPWEMQQCASCKDVNETMSHWVICCSTNRNPGENASGFFRSSWVSCEPELHFCLMDTINVLIWLVFLFLLVSKKLKANIMTSIKDVWPAFHVLTSSCPFLYFLFALHFP